MTYEEALRLEQYKTLRNEIERHDQHRSRIQYASLLASVAAVAWILERLTNDTLILDFMVLAVVPVSILLAGKHIASSHVVRSKQAGEFIRDFVEPALPNKERWESYLRPEDGSKGGEVTKPTESVFLMAAFVEGMILMVTFLQQ